MQQVFIELYNYRPAWAKCPESERTDFAKKVVEAVKGLKSAGVDVVAYGMNSPETDRRAPYDFFCVYRVPNVELQREFERQIVASGWYDYFEQVNVSGDAPPHHVREFKGKLLRDHAAEGKSDVSKPVRSSARQKRANSRVIAATVEGVVPLESPIPG